MSGILPQALANRPVLASGNQEYLDAFNFLDASRQLYEGGVQAITVQEILAYCALSRTPRGEPALKLLRVVQHLDNVRINHWHKKNKKP